MPAAPIPNNEAARIEALLGCQILDTPPEQRFDDLTLLAARITKAPISLVSLVDKGRQWFKSHHGIDATETPRDQAFCGYAILTPTKPLIVADTALDPRFIDNPLVTGEPGIRFYAGTPLVNEEGFALGTLCVIDTVPRELDAEQLEGLEVLGRQVTAQLQLTKLIDELQQQNDEQARNFKRMLEYKNQLEVSIGDLERLSTTDTLTGLSNRRAFNQQLLMEFGRSVRQQTDLSLVMIDLDHFKQVNDRLGHPVGDEVLKSLGKLLKDNRRIYDTISRYGGEEFALIFPNTSPEQAEVLAERLRLQIEGHTWPCDALTASIGITHRHPDDDNQTFLSRADRALYAAKKAGRNCVCSL